MRFRLLAAIVAALVASTCQTGKAELLVFGEHIVITGSGTYTANILAQAIGADYEVGGYNISLDVSNPAVAFESLAIAPEFESTLNPSDDPVLIQASDTDFSGLTVNDGQTVTLATVGFTVQGPAEVPITLTAPVASTVFSVIPSSVGAPISFSAVPEPSTAALGCCAGLGYFVRRRRT